MLFFKIFKSQVSGLVQIFRHYSSYKSARSQFVEYLQEWKEKLGKNDYHGGKLPDEADFAVLYLILRY